MTKLTRMHAVALAALLASCGGGESVQTAATPVPVLRAAAGSLSAATPADGANQLMDWAEAQPPFQGFFPEHQATQIDVFPFVYRHYSSGVFLGVVTSDNLAFPLGGVYLLGGIFGGAPFHVGQVSDFSVQPPAPGPSAAASCPAFTSANYRAIKPAPAGQQTLITVAAITMDGAGTPRIAFPGGPARTLAPGVAPCSFNLPDGSGVAVSPASVALMASVEGTDRYPALLFPDQTIALSDVSGVWNRLSWNRRDPGGFDQPYKLSYGAFTLIASGAVTAGTECSVAVDLSGGCQAGTLNGGLAANSSGGFSGTGELSGGRIFAYKKGTDTMMVAIDPDGSLTILTPQAISSLPAAGSSTTVWNTNANTAGVLAVGGTNAIAGFATNINIVTSVDIVNSVVIRSSTQDGSTPVTQTLRYNVPLAGFRKRDGVPNLVAASILLPVRGMGLTATSRLGAIDATIPGTGNGFLGLTIDQP
jgi:hypothetical protein